MQYVSRTLGIAKFTGLLKQDWERPLTVKKEKTSGVESSFSQNYVI
jgi:hypothetical protein